MTLLSGKFFSFGKKEFLFLTKYSLLYLKKNCSYFYAHANIICNYVIGKIARNQILKFYLIRS